MENQELIQLTDAAGALPEEVNTGNKLGAGAKVAITAGLIVGGVLLVKGVKKLAGFVKSKMENKAAKAEVTEEEAN